MNLSRSITGAVALAVSLLASLPATAEMTLDPGISVTFHHHDLLGSPVMVSDHKGRVLWYENTKPYGEGLGKKSSSGLGHLDNTVNEATSNLGYTGHTVDSSTGLVYMKARHYDPVIGRFYSNDPIGFKVSNPVMFNRYAYANNNPYKYVDTNGEIAILLPALGAVLLGGAAIYALDNAIKNSPSPSDVADYFKSIVMNNESDESDRNNAPEEKNESSDLPENPDDLLDQGYEENSHPEAKARGHRTFHNSTTGDTVRYDEGEEGKPGHRGEDHYHRYNPDATSKRDEYLDAEGNPTGRNSEASHIQPKTQQ